MLQNNAGALVYNALRYHNMSMQTLLILAVEMDKTAHRVQQTFGNRNPQSKSIGKTCGASISLIKVIIHFGQLNVRHTNTSIINIYYQINTIGFLPITYTDIQTALFRKFDRVFHQNFQHVRNFFRVANQNCRQLWVNIKHHLKMLPVCLQRRRCDNIIQN